MSYCVERKSVIWAKWLLWYQCTPSRGHYVSMLVSKLQDFTAVYELNSGLLCFEVALRCFPYDVNANTSICGVFPLVQCHGWEAFMHLADAFIQSDLQCIQVMHEKVVLILGSPHQRIAVSWSAPIVLWDVFVELHVCEISIMSRCSC